MLYKKLFLVLAAVFFMSGWSFSPRESITIIYSADSHGNLYPCDCKKQEDGGLSRRSSLIKKFKKADPETILIEGGNFFAGGPFDENKSTQDLDKKRTFYFLQCMDLMGYDCLALGEDELAFGKDFLLDAIHSTKTPFLSTNTSETPIKPYIIREVHGIKLAILSIFPEQKSSELKVYDWHDVLRDYISKLKEMQGIDLIALISGFDEDINKQIVSEFPSIDLILAPFDYSRPRTFQKIGNSLIVYPVFEGRRLIKVDLFLDKKKIRRFKVKNFRLSDKIGNDPQVDKIIPRCFSDEDCRQHGRIAKCENPGTLDARCIYTEPLDFTITVIKPKNCITCSADSGLEKIKDLVGDYFKVKSVNEFSREGKQLIKLFDIDSIPAFISSKDIEKYLKSDRIKAHFTSKDDYYLLNSEFSKANCYINRKEISGKLDLFVSLFDKDTFHLLSLARSLDFSLKKKFDLRLLYPKDENSRQEALRFVAIRKFNPDLFWDYCLKRATDCKLNDWKTIASSLGIDTNFINNFIKTQKCERLLQEDLALAKDLRIKNSGVYLLNNREVFVLSSQASFEDVQKTLQRNRRQ